MDDSKFNAQLPLELLREVSAYHKGEGKYNFSHLSPYDRDNAAFDAWQDIFAEISHVLRTDGIGKCRTCRFKCELDKAPSDGFGCCDSEQFTQGQKHAIGGRDPASCDFEFDESGQFFVGPEFGCIHWEHKSMEKQA